METLRSLEERALEELLWMTTRSKRQGVVVMRDRDGLRHGVWVHGGFVVGIHVAGLFDPLLEALHRAGTLNSSDYLTCVQVLTENGPRSGAVAIEIGGASRPHVRDALQRQSRNRMRALLQVAGERGHDARFEPGPVPDCEIGIRMPLGSLLPDRIRKTSREHSRAQARRRLRALARKLHPDLHTHLDERERKRLEQDLAAATAEYHGLTG